MKHESNEIKRKRPYILDLQMFADVGGGDGGEEGGDAGGGGGDGTPKKLELTQEEFDAKIADRLARERKKYADYDDVKTKLSDYEKAEEERTKAAMTESERLKAEKDEADRLAAEAVESGSKAIQSANQRIIRSEFKLLAKEAGIRSDALDDAYVLADKAAITVDDDGNVTGASEVITALLAAKPFLAEPKKEPRQIGSGSGGDDPKPDKTKEQLLAAAAEKARASGKTEDRVAFAALKRELDK